MAIVGAAVDCDGWGGYRCARSASARQVAARATRLDTQPDCFQSQQVLFQFSKSQISKLRHSSSHSARDASAEANFVSSNSTEGKSPDMVILPCGRQAG